MRDHLKLPIGIENFEEIRTEDFYYVDKTGLIKELLEHWGKVNLFTRPRRFGKSLNMNMLKYFFEYGCDQRLFEGLKITGERELCEKYMGNFPVIFLTLKDIMAKDYRGACGMFAFDIRNEALRFLFLRESNQLSDEEKVQFNELLIQDGTCEKEFNVYEEILVNSLLVLTRVLAKHYGKKVILLIDEYDVPLDKAQQYGYYDEMVIFLHNMFSRVLKSNDYLQFAVLTGCLRISKESIFTGLNNMRIYSVTERRFDEYFGFTDAEVRQLLTYYGVNNKYDLVKEWYDGYYFGNMEVYCPWDVINYVDALQEDEKAFPDAYWTNTSDNMVIRNLMNKMSAKTKHEVEQLIAGQSIKKKIDQNLTYRDLYKKDDTLWSMLFATGYLTSRGKSQEGEYFLAIPNQEIHKIFIEQVMDWFQSETRKDGGKLDSFCTALHNADTSAVEIMLNDYLMKSISIRDTGARKGNKENFYHGILLGLLNYREDWYVYSNMESGEGYSDILVETEDGTGIIIEIKYAENGNMEEGCNRALNQIEEREYKQKLLQDGMENIVKCAIACYKKKCKIVIK